MEWVVGISGSPHDLRELAKSIRTPEASITKENGQFLIRSIRFDPAADAATVRQEAEVLIRLLNGAAALELGPRQPLGLGSIYRIRDDGTKEFFVVCAGGISAGGTVGAVTVKHADGTEDVIVFHPADSIPGWLKVALRDPVVAKVLRYLSRDPRWADLYNVLETIRDDMGGEDRIEAARWATKKEQGRFTHTANNYLALKEDARHSREDRSPPANPMQLSDATAFIKTIAQAWLKYKASS